MSLHKFKSITNEIHNTSDDFTKLALYITKLTLNYNVSSHIIDFFHDLLKFTGITFNNIIEILNGAYVIIKYDRRAFYNKFKKYNYMMVNQGFGGSSHYSRDKQARIGSGTLMDPINNLENRNFDLLIGTIDNSRLSDYNEAVGKYSSWFQFEEARGDLPSSSNIISWYTGQPTIHSAKHLGSSFKYFRNKSTNFILNRVGLSVKPLKNIGPLGESIYNDSEPLVLNMCKTPRKINSKIIQLIRCKKYKTNINQIQNKHI